MRHPGAGRKKGQINRITVEARTLVSQLVGNPNYQHKLRRDFELRKVHPTIESLVWQYHLGKPTQPVNIQGGLSIDIDARLDEERRVFASLDIADLEQLAAESQALVDRAFQLAVPSHWIWSGPTLLTCDGPDRLRRSSAARLIQSGPPAPFSRWCLT